MKLNQSNMKKKLGMTKEEINIVLTFQENMPILQEEVDGFAVNTRQLHTQLGVGKDYSTWIKGRIKKYNFKENEDYIVVNLIPQNGGIKKQGGDRKSKDYIVTMDMAKELALLENNPQGDLARQYFILMEKVVKRVLDWEATRSPEKIGYKKMCEALRKRKLALEEKEPEGWEYAKEANMLNIYCLGVKAKEIREIIEAEDKNTRDWLLEEYNNMLCEMQNVNTVLLGIYSMSDEERYKEVLVTFVKTFPNAKDITKYFNRQ